MNNDDNFCDGCGYYFSECKCNYTNEDGYECSKCGAIPTKQELNNGWCNHCREDKV